MALCAIWGWFVSDPVKAKLAADALSTKADVLVYSGGITMLGFNRVHSCLGARVAKKHDTLILVLSTFGGDPHYAYRIARCIASNYSRFVVWIVTFCKSAGTLTCLGANELVMFDKAELGPLDMQVLKPDELEDFGSGLDMVQALTFLEGRAHGAFLDALRTIHDTGLATKLAGEMASALTHGLYSGIFSQLDPVRLGEVSRVMRVGQEYGERLQVRGKNLRADAIQKLVATYPSHGFVIDREEAATMFREVRAPTDDEAMLGDAIADGASMSEIATARPHVCWVEEMAFYKDADASIVAQSAQSFAPATQGSVSPLASSLGEPSGTTSAKEPTLVPQASARTTNGR